MPNFFLFNSEEEAVASEAQIVANCFFLYIFRGWIVIDNAIVPKNALTGEDEPDAVRTEGWAIPQYSGEYWYFEDPRAFLEESASDQPPQIIAEMKAILLQNVVFDQIDGWTPFV